MTDHSGPERPPLKPGIKSSEFYVSLALMLVTLLVCLGLVDPADEASLVGDLADLLTDLAALLASAHVVARYVGGRTTLKLQALEDTHENGG